MRREDLQERMRIAHQKLTMALDGLSEDEAKRVGLTSQWSIKDSLSHIAAWEIEGASIIGEIQNGTWKPKRFDKQAIDDFNARVVEERLERSFGEVRAEFDAAHTHMEQTIAALPEEIDQSSLTYTFVEAVTFKHHGHHAEQIEKFRTGSELVN